MRRLSFISLVLGTALITTPAWATTVADPVGDFLASYTGAQNGSLDIVSASATFDGTSLLLSSTQNGAAGSSAGSLFVWGINRGAGSARLALGSPSIGAGILWDAVAVLFPDGSARAVTFPTAGPPTITPIAGAVTIDGNTISGVIPLALLPSTGFAPTDYTFTLWSRLRVNPAADGTNAEIADFAPNAAGIHASIPEPDAWALMLMGMGGIGAIVRRQRSLKVRARGDLVRSTGKA